MQSVSFGVPGDAGELSFNLVRLLLMFGTGLLLARYWRSTGGDRGDR
jgi:hypothetical protein